MTDSFSVQNFKKDTSGTMTMWNVISMIGLLSIGGLAVDTSNAWRVKAMLQNTADVSALAAAIHIEDQSAAKDMAVNFARRNMPQNVHGDVVRRGDVEFGTYDSATQIFTPTKMNPDAVRVYAGRDSARSNAVSTYLLKLTGITDLDVGRGSIAYPKWGGNETEEWPIGNRNWCKCVFRCRCTTEFDKRFERYLRYNSHGQLRSRKSFQTTIQDA